MRLFEFVLQSLGAGDLGEQFEEGGIGFGQLQKHFTEARFGVIRLGIIPECVKIRQRLS